MSFTATVFLVLTTIVQAAGLPTGIYALTQGGQPIPPRILAHDVIEGIVVRGKWQDVEPTRKAYDWRYFDEQISRIDRSGKAISLVVTSGGLATPAWAAQASQTFHFIDNNRFHKTAGQKVIIPLFWDADFLAEKKRLIAALGERYARQPRLRLVSAQCANATTDDWNIPGTPEDIIEWKRLGFSQEKMLQACKEILDATMAAFPTQHVRMAFGRVPPGLAANPGALAEEIVRYTNSRYPGRLIVMRHNLAANTPVATSSGNLHGWALLRDHASQAAAQFLWPASDTRSCRLDRSTAPCSAPDMFGRTIHAAISYRLRFIEIYTVDLVNSELANQVSQLARDLVQTLAGNPSAASLIDAPAERSTQRQSTVRATDGMPHNSAWPRGGPPQADSSRAPPQGIQHHTFIGPHTQQGIRYSIFLPPGYTQSTHRYPVIYWLHGKGGDERRGTHIARYLAEAVSSGLLAEAIMVFPNGGEASFYTDAPDGSWPVETMILKDLIPHIESQYRVIPEKRGRFLMGFSMGGFGALKFAAKYPERFAAVVAYGAPRLDKSLGMGGGDADSFGRVFNQDMARFEQNTPSYLFRINREKVISERLKIRLVAGEADNTRHSVQRLHEVLGQLGIPHDYEMLPSVRHVVGQYYEAERGRGFAMLGALIPAAR